MPFADLLRLTFLVTLLSCCGYAWWSGGRVERLGASIIFVGAVLSYPAAVYFGDRWQSPEYGVLVIDVLATLALIALSLRFDPYWPLFGAAFQLVAVITHLASIVNPLIVPRAYSLAQPFWAYPLLASLVIGTWNHSRRNSVPVERP